MARLYPLSLALEQAKQVAAERRLGPVCVNCLSGRNLTDLVTIEKLDVFVQAIVDDTYAGLPYGRGGRNGW